MTARPRAPAEPADEAAEDTGVDDRAGEAGEAGARQPICTVAFCPLCTAVTAIGEMRPEVVEHLLLAGREFLLAVRAVVDARLEATEAQPAKARIERISIE
ncbi:MAG TPA: hypothetical protein VEN82_08825 [Actinomycetota bacterium]|nr:hypothetical protein [Actinomycetota bacterium]